MVSTLLHRRRVCFFVLLPETRNAEIPRGGGRDVGFFFWVLSPWSRETWLLSSPGGQGEWVVFLLFYLLCLKKKLLCCNAGEGR